MKLGLDKIWNFKLSRDADVWLRFWIWCLVEMPQIKFDQDLCVHLVIWPEQVTLVSRTQPSGPLCLWQCFQISGLARAGYNQEGSMEVFPLIYGFLYVRQLPLIPACLLLVWILQALQLLGLEFPLNSAPLLSTFSARCLIICLKSQVLSPVFYHSL